MQGRTIEKSKKVENQEKNENSQTLVTNSTTTTFCIDNLILSKTVQGNFETQTYDNRGRITTNKTGTYNYLDTDKPYQQTSVTPVNANESAFYGSRGNLSITYNAFKAPVQIEEIGKDKLSFAYNGMLERSAMYFGSIADDKLDRPNRRYYSADGSMEVNYNKTSGAVEFLTFIGGDAYNSPIVLKSDGTTPNYFYLHRDYQGTIVAVTNATGGIVEKRHFDAWGAITKVQDGAGNNLGKLTFFERGYTGHEHLQSVGLIHMNGRLYDPKLHRFLQPDNFVQDPYNTQNYNRYGYVTNNPLKYTDPSGEFAFIVAVAIGAAVALTSNLVTAWINHTPLTFVGLYTSTLAGGLSAAVTFGIGQATEGIKCFVTRAAVQAAAHGMFQGGMSAWQGGSFWSGFATGAISSIAASAWTGGSTIVENGNVTEEFVHEGLGSTLGLQNGVGTVLFGSLAGGVGATLTGGNFWRGAITGAIVSGLNHTLHGGKKISKSNYTYRKIDKSINSEKLVYFQKGKYRDAFGKLKSDKPLYDLAVSEVLKPNTISIYGHGYYHSLFGTSSYEQIVGNISNDSLLYNTMSKSGGTLEFHSCYSGRFGEGQPTIAEAVSSNTNLAVWGAADYWSADPQWSSTRTLNNGGWNLFIGGENVGHSNYR